MALSDFSEALLLNWFLSGTGSPPANTWIELFTTPTNDAGTGGTIVTGTGYARAEYTGGWTVAGVATRGSNDSQVTFAQAGGAWSGPMLSFGVYTLVTGGSLLWHANLTDQTKTVASGDVLVFNADALGLTFT